MVAPTMVIGVRTVVMDRAPSLGPVAAPTLVSSRMIDETGVAKFATLTSLCMMVNGATIRKTARGRSSGTEAPNLLVASVTTSSMGREFSRSRVVPILRVNGAITRRMVRV